MATTQRAQAPTSGERALPGKQKIVTYLWYDNQAEEAAKHYTSIFKNSKILNVTRYGDAGPGPKGAAMVVNFQLERQEFIALNGGPQFKFTEAISLLVNCDSQREVDDLWSKLSAGGEESQCGWLKDKFGLSWQIIPTALFELMQDPDPKKSKRVMEAMLQMKKIDIAALKRAHAGQ
jgi:predicted 3-demethylubiquinone-9 3-methyltransferase (glyoxalase superfamily)